MRIEHFVVRNNFLQKYVDYYYLLSTVGDARNTEYLAFPSCNSPLGFFKNASFSGEPEKIRMKFSADDSLQVLLVGNFLKPLDIIFEPNITEFAVVFKPLGINHFVKQNLGETMSQDVSPIRCFTKLLPVVKKLFEGIDAFDEFEEKLISAFSTNDQLQFLETIITEFLDTENKFAGQRISSDLNTSGKQLFRLVKKHLGVNPTQFRQLLRFRSALDSTLRNLERRNLTEIGLHAGYYDQPHFIKEFRKITNLTPRDFLSKISLEANDQVAWQFITNASESYN